MTADTKAALATNSGRLVGLDLARALAMLGMLTVNFKLVMGVESIGSSWLVTLLGYVDGKAAGLFVVIAGVGLSLSRSRLDQRRIWLARALVLFVFGLAFALLWPADILHFYALYIVVGLAFVDRTDRTLLVAFAGFVLAFVVLLAFVDYDAHWDWETLEYRGMWTSDGMVRHLLFNGFHPVFPWASFFLFGMWLGRRNLRSAATRNWLLGTSIPLLLVTELLSNTLGGFEGSLFGTAMMPPMPLYIVASVCASIIIIVVAVFAADRLSRSRLADAVQISGRYSLTIYLAHVVVGLPALWITGLIPDAGDRPVATIATASAAAALFWMAAVYFSSAWHRRVGIGPAEWLFRTAARSLASANQNKES